jgi:hypothetical protein
MLEATDGGMEVLDSTGPPEVLSMLVVANNDDDKPVKTPVIVELTLMLVVELIV